MRVFLGLTEVSGCYRGLKRGFEMLGVPCTFINLGKDPFNYAGGDSHWAARSMKRIEALVEQRSTPKWLKSILKKIHFLLRCFLFIWALCTHDVFIFGFNTSFFSSHGSIKSILHNYEDLPILKWFGKKIIYQFHGSDSRPPYIDGSVMSTDRGRTLADCIYLARKKKGIIRQIDKYADVLIDIPPQGHFHERPFILWLLVGIACPPTQIPTLPTEKERQPNTLLRILHCPSHPEAKGSQVIKTTVQHLIDHENLPIQLIELVGQPNDVVLSELSNCDLVIDQLYADYGMPGFATEAAWFGKPVIICGYAAPLWDELLPAENRLPTYYCHPDELENSVRRFVTDESLRNTLGQRAYHFVRNQWNPQLIAQRYLDLLSKPIPARWLYDPQQISYWQGCCFHENRIKELLKGFIEEGGVAALQLSDKPALESLFVSVANS